MSAQPSCTIDGFGPIPVLRPATPAEVGDAVRRAAAEAFDLLLELFDLDFLVGSAVRYFAVT